MAQVIATVVSVIGEAFVRDAQGNTRSIKPGDALLEGETVITSAGGQVELAMADGSSLVVVESQVVGLGLEMLDEGAPGAQESAVSASTVDEILQALEAGESIDALLEAPAAGLAGGADAEGSSFVRLLRVAEDTTGVDYDYSFELQSGLVPEPGDAVETVTGIVSLNYILLDDNGQPLLGPDGNFIFVDGSDVVEGTPIGVLATVDVAPTGSNLVLNLSNGLVITIPVGQTTGVAVLETRPDDLFIQGTDTLPISVVGASGGGYDQLDATQSSSVNVVDDNDPVFAVISVNLPSVNEGGVLTYTVRLVDEEGNPVTVPEGTSVEVRLVWSGEAANPTDAAPLPATVTILGGTSQTVFQVNTVNDSVHELTEPLIAAIAEVVDAQSIFENLGAAAPSADSQIVDNDVPTILVGRPGTGTGDITVPEGSNANFGIVITNAGAGSTVSLALADGTAVDADYHEAFFQYSTDGGATWQAVSGPIAVGAGDSTLLVRTDTVDDLIVENNETFTLTGTLSSLGDTYSDTATATILDNDVPDIEVAEIEIADVVVTEGQAAVFLVTVTNAGAGSTVSLALADGTAVDADYNEAFFEYSTDGGTTWQAVSGPIAVGAGDSTLLVRTDTVDDLIAENSETFTLTGTLSSLGDTYSDTATATILDNDVPDIEVAGIETADVVVTEGQAAVFLVTVTNAGAGSTVSLALADGTAVDADYNEAFFEYSTDGGTTWQAVSGPIAVGAGDSTLLVRTDTVDDLIAENSETFTLTGTLSSLGETYSDTATATILDNDVPDIEVAGIETADVVVTEGQAAVFLVTVTNAGAGSTVSLALADGTAVDADYHEAFFEYSTDGGTTWQAVSGPIAVGAGDSTLLVRTDTVDDLIDEGDETFTLTGTLSSLGDTYSDTATATIIDNDVVPTINPSALAVSEEGLAGGLQDMAGTSDTTNLATRTGSISYSGNSAAALTVTLSTTGLPTSLGGTAINWSYESGNEAILVGRSGGGLDIIRITLNDGSTTVDTSNSTIAYTVELLRPVSHPGENQEDVLSFDVGVRLSDGVNAAQTADLTITIEDDSPLVASNYAWIANEPASFIGQLAFIGADTGGSAGAQWTTSLSSLNGLGLTSGGRAVTFSYASGQTTLIASTTDGPVFTVTANADGTYSFNSLAPLDLSSLNLDDATVSSGGGPKSTYYWYDDGSLKNTVDAGKDLVLSITGYKNGALADVNPSGAGIGIHNNEFDRGEKFVFDFDAAGSDGEANLAYAVRFALFQYGADDTFQVTGMYQDGTSHVDGYSIETIDGTTYMVVTAESGKYFDTLEVAMSDGKVKIQGLETYVLEDAPPQLVTLDFTAVDADGDEVDGSVALTFQNQSYFGGGSGNDILVGGAGNDDLDGNLGSDAFVWNLGDQGTAASPAVDRVDFNVDEGDVLDLRDLLPNDSSDSLSSYLSFGSVDGKLALLVDHDGGSTFEATQKIVLENYASTTDLANALELDAGWTEADILNRLIADGQLKNG